MGLQGFNDLSHQWTNIGPASPLMPMMPGDMGKNPNMGNNDPNTPGGLNGWFSTLSMVMANNAAMQRSILEGINNKEYDVQTVDGFKADGKFIGKDDYGNNMYQTEGVDEIVYTSEKSDVWEESINEWFSWNGPIMRYFVPDKISISLSGDLSFLVALELPQLILPF